RRSLLEAYQQLLRYREDLENPPLLVVCDLNRFEIHTNFTGKPTVVFAFDLDHLSEPANLDVLQLRDLLLMAFSATLARINRTFLSTTNRRESRGGSAIFSIYR